MTTTTIDLTDTADDDLELLVRYGQDHAAKAARVELKARAERESRRQQAATARGEFAAVARFRRRCHRPLAVRHGMPPTGRSARFKPRRTGCSSPSTICSRSSDP